MAEHPWSAPAALRDALAPAAWVEAVLAYEAVLASAQAERGAIPAASAERIAAVCADPAALGIDGQHPVPAIVAALREAAGPAAASDVHRGASEQDAADTASALVARRGLAQIDGDLAALQRRLTDARAAEVARVREVLAAVPFHASAHPDVEALVAAGLGLGAGEADPGALARGLDRSAATLTGIGEGPHVEAAAAARERLVDLSRVTAWRRRWPLLAEALLAVGASAALLRAALREGRVA